MADTIPSFVLVRATSALYPADADGNPVLSEPVWMGARTERVRFPQELAEVENSPSGAAYDEFAQLSELSQVSIDRIWVLPKRLLRDYELKRGRFVMIFQDRDPLAGVWTRITCYGVQALTYTVESIGVMNLISNQTWRVQRIVKEAGKVGSDGEELPVVTAVDEQPLLFTHEFSLESGSYFIGCYQFAAGVCIGRTKAIAQASVGAATDLALEVNGVVTACTLTLPAGTGEVSDEDDFHVDIAANARLRWKVVSAPGSSADQAMCCGVTMTIVEEDA